MKNWDNGELNEDQKKWSQWSMKPKATGLKLTNYTSAIVIMTASVQMVAFNLV